MRYRLTLTIHSASHLDKVLAALAPTDPEITLSLMPKLEPESTPAGPDFRPDGLFPPTVKKRATRGDGGAWPAEGSIYSTVLAALGGEAKTPEQLRDALKEAGFAAASLNSALVRLEKASKIRKDNSGYWAAA